MGDELEVGNYGALIGDEMDGDNSIENDVSDVDQADGQSQNTDAGHDENQGDETPESILEQLAKDENNQASNVDFSKALEQINALGFVRNGQAFALKDEKELKEYIQKGFDYTAKTSEHAELVRAKETEFAEKEKAFVAREEAIKQSEEIHNEIIRDHDVFNGLINEWKIADPELFQFIAQEYQKKISALEANKPLFDKYQGQLGDLKNEIETLKKGQSEKKLETIRADFDKGLKEVQEKHMNAFKKLGVTVDWAKVKETWSNDAKGEMTIEQALYATFGDAIVKANASYAKMLKTKQKTTERMSGGSRNSASSAPARDENIVPGNYNSILRDYLDE